MTVTEHVSERQAREVAEQARETQWRQPSFAKELFLGRLRLDLVHPHPSGPPEAAERGEAFLAKLREFCESQIDAAVIERDGQIPDKVVRGLKELGAFGMKIGTKYGGVGLSQLYYNKALALVGSVHPSLARVAFRAPVDRCAAAHFDVRHRGAEANVAAPVYPGDQRVPAHRAGRGQRPGPGAHHRHPGRR